MPLAIEPFFDWLTESGLLSAEEVRAVVAGLPSGQKPRDGEQLARELVRAKKLTAYQAKEIYSGRGKSLVLGNYVILDKLGQGGMGMVLKAEHRRMKRLVALKVLSPAVTKTPEALRRFQREVEAAARLEHPNIVTAHDADEANKTHFLVMQYVDGTDLSSLVKTNGPLRLAQALPCILQAARGLEYAHQRGVVHRDIKPGNLLLDKEGTLKILDMGLARLESAGDRQDELTGTGQVMGTVDYMAPEQALSTRDVDARADIYALGATLWYLLTGRAMYDGETAVAKLMAHQTRPIPPLCESCEDVPPDLEAVFERMVAKTPEVRYQSMSEVLAALEACRGAGGSAPSLGSAVSEDSRLLDFLQSSSGASGGKPGSSGVMGKQRTRKGATASHEATFSVSTPQVDTDPKTDQSLPGPLLPATAAATGTRVKGKKSPDKRILAALGAGGVVLCLALVWVLTREGSEPSRKSTRSSSPSRAPRTFDGPKIQTDDPQRQRPPLSFTPQMPAQTLQDPAFQSWVQANSALPPEKQVQAVVKRLQELNPGYDGKETHKNDGDAVAELSIITDEVTNLAPLRALTKLKVLHCGGSGQVAGKLADLSPLAGMRLTHLNAAYSQVTDLSPVAGMPLEGVDIYSSPVQSLAPLAGMRIKHLDAHHTQISDLSPLAGAPLEMLRCDSTSVYDLSPLRGAPLFYLRIENTWLPDLSPLRETQIRDLGFNYRPLKDEAIVRSLKTLAFVGGYNMESFWHLTAEAKSAFEKWKRDVSALGPEEQLAAVIKKLQEFNPGYDGQEQHRVENGAVVQLSLSSDAITDILPVQALAGLKDFYCSPGTVTKGRFTDLSPLSGMAITRLNVYCTKVSNLSPLAGLPLVELNCSYTWVKDFTPLAKCPKLARLDVSGMAVSPANIAALQAALPDCKIAWSDPGKK